MGLVGTPLVVIDFETLSTHQDATVLSLAATCFHPEAKDDIHQLRQQTVSWNFDIFDQDHRHKSVDTKLFWDNQPKSTWNAHRAKPLYHPRTVLYKLNEFIGISGAEYLIGNGKNFDNSLLKNLCEAYNVSYPIPFWGDLDLRTMRWLATIDKPIFPKELTEHIASDDCIYEAMSCQRYYANIKHGQK